MERFIDFDETLCDNCYKCLRVCPSKCISFNGKTREVIDELCIKCGACQRNCPQNALVIRNSVHQVISFIRSRKMTAVSIAPSYVSAFNLKDPSVISSALKRLGFDIVEETSVGAEIVSQGYEYITRNVEHENVITTACPSTNYFIMTHYPNLVKYMLPVVSPMVAHGRYIKKRYGDDVKVVFIGPCLAKMAEANEYPDIDAVITFNNLDEWLKDEGIDLNTLEKGEFDLTGSLRGKAYPLYNKNFESGGKYKHLRVDGVDDCIQVLNELDAGVLSGYSIDISMCSGSCINGLEMPHNGDGRYQREMRLVKYIQSKQGEEITLNVKHDVVDTHHEYKKSSFTSYMPSEEQIKKALAKAGKYSEEDELNCGACGYTTCREKAIAVCRGWSEATDCMQYLRDKAISKHSLLIENSPNAICIVDKSFCIVECNPAFEEMFNRKNIKMEGIPIRYFIDDALVREGVEEGKSIIGRHIFDKDSNKYFIANIVISPKDDDLIFMFLNDITEDEKKKRELANVKKETLKKTQEVIDKQMRVAQEIAGLLGETTAETKINLNSLKKLVLDDE